VLGWGALVDAFGLGIPAVNKRHIVLCASDQRLEDDDSSQQLSRRDVLLQSGTRSTAFALWTVAVSYSTASQSAFAESATPPKVVVLGGSGFVGSQVVATLQSMGVPVVSTSTTGRDGTVALDLTSSDAQAQLEKILAGGTTAVISCVGKIGTDEDEVVNAATGRAAMTAKAAGVERFVYITVAPEVKDFASDIEFLSGYMKGKMYSRDAVLSHFSDKATLIEPTFIYGGGSFETNPPRVPGSYGQLIEGLLSASPVRQVERIMSPGIIKIALEPPVGVEDVAKAAVAGALGRAPISILDTYDKIKTAAAAIA
jgi:nucleoside-diphosphate-sugar epimerase